MPRYLNTRGKPVLTIAVCDRCREKNSLSDLSPDGNSPGLLVCRDCNDMYDPWRLPARRTEDITVPTPRPDEPLT